MLPVLTCSIGSCENELGCSDKWKTEWGNNIIVIISGKPLTLPCIQVNGAQRNVSLNLYSCAVKKNVHRPRQRYRLHGRKSNSEWSKRHKHALSASANRWMVVECNASGAAHTDQMFPMSQQPFYNCQHSQRGILTLYLTSIDSLNTAVGHTSTYRTHTCSAVDTHTHN